ncbi:MAG: hypothetical protein KKC19_02685 [Nanoarchaeota archaeon]|nr:hypothetical protein [Nanoarchaeota archaeon]
MVTGLSFGEFYGIDSLIELLIFAVSLQIAYYSNRIYKILKERDYKLLSLGFLFIGLSLLFKIISNLTILERIKIDDLYFLNHLFLEFGSLSITYLLSFSIYKFMYLIGFLFLFVMTTEIKNKKNIIMYIYLGAVTIFFSIYFNSLFHLTIALTLAMLTMNFYENYKKVMNRNTKTVFLAFFVMMFGHLFLLFSEDLPLLYIIGKITVLIGFASLLFNQIQINNEKKNKIGSPEGHSRTSRKGKRA